MSANAKKDLGPTDIGLEANVAACLAYLVGLLSGLIIFLIEKKNKFVRFHALQSILFSIVISVLLWILLWIPILGWMLSGLVMLGSFVLWIVLLVKAYQGEQIKLPVIGDIAEKKA